MSNTGNTLDNNMSAPSTAPVGSDQPPSATQIRRKRSKYWSSGQMVVVGVKSEEDPMEIILFHIQVDMFSARSIVLDQILSIPPRPGSKEGTEEDPIIIPNVSAEAFYILTDFLQRRQVFFSRVNPPASLIGVSVVGIIFKKRERTSYAFWPLVELLFLARHHHVRPGVRNWIKPALVGILSKHLCDLTREEEQKIGPAYFAIARAHERFGRARRYIASSPFDLVNNDGASTHDLQCQKAWNFSWYQRIAPHIIHPEKPPLSWADLALFVEQTTLPYVDNACKRATVAHMRAFEDYPNGSTIIHDAVTEIITVYQINLAASY
ncbi:hypothetical protein FB446DRAFT_794542 [Lentinula raphanica]|nr:hypothetical protein FB446DRAFT_794542 [Lentinula raphanica]